MAAEPLGSRRAHLEDASRVLGWTMDVLLPLSMVFVLLRYTDLGFAIRSDD